MGLGRGALVLGVLAGCCCQVSEAWWDNGHMLVAEVARQSLDASVVDRVNRMLTVFRPNFPNRTTFSEAATWADFLKCQSESSFCRGIPESVNAFDAWHFSDRPYDPNGIPLPESQYPMAWASQPSSIDAVTQAVGTFRSSKSPWGYGLMMMFSLHFVGDMHQPLHSVSGYFNDSRFGDLSGGDRGGNLIHINCPQFPGATNLHALWDSAGGQYLENSPLSPTQTAALVANATQLILQHPPASFPQLDEDEFPECWVNGGGYNEPCKNVIEKWANESYDLAVSVAYGPSISQNATITQAYLNQVQQTSREQITLAGYRLASMISSVAATIPPGALVKSQTGEGTNDTDAASFTPLERGLLAALLLSWGLMAVVVAINPARLRLRQRKYQAVVSVNNDDDEALDIA